MGGVAAEWMAPEGAGEGMGAGGEEVVAGEEWKGAVVVGEGAVEVVAAGAKVGGMGVVAMEVVTVEEELAAAMGAGEVGAVGRAVGEEDWAGASMAAADCFPVAAAGGVAPSRVVCSVEAVNSVVATGRKVVEMEETSARTYSRFARISVRPHMGGRRQRLAAPMLA